VTSVSRLASSVDASNAPEHVDPAQYDFQDGNEAAGMVELRLVVIPFSNEGS
jgi:hypothetical protein